MHARVVQLRRLMLLVERQHSIILLQYCPHMSLAICAETRAQANRIGLKFASTNATGRRRVTVPRACTGTHLLTQSHAHIYMHPRNCAIEKRLCSTLRALHSHAWNAQNSFPFYTKTFLIDLLQYRQCSYCCTIM